MAFEIEKENTGIAFPNDGSEAGGRKPQWSGSVNVEGKQLRVAIWENEGGKLGLVFSEHQERSEAPARSSGGGGGRKTYTKPQRRS